MRVDIRTVRETSLKIWFEWVDWNRFAQEEPVEDSFQHGNVLSVLKLLKFRD
jgi:hypothetical protein